MHAATLCAAIALGCTKHDSSPPPIPSGPKKPRVDVTLWLDPRGDVPADGVALNTSTLPSSQTLERAGIRLTTLGMPKGLSATDTNRFLSNAVTQLIVGHVNAIVVVTAACLADVEPVLEKNPIGLWPIAVVVGAGCDREFKPFVGVTALVEAGKASRVRMTFDRHTGFVLKIEPIR